MDTYKSGLFAEWCARMFLRLHGFKILKSRYMTGKNTGRAEIDIIARRRNLIIFVEVKRRPNFDTAWAAITAPQIRRLRAAAETYIARTKWCGNARFDTIFVCGGRIYWQKNSI